MGMGRKGSKVLKERVFLVKFLHAGTFLRSMETAMEATCAGETSRAVSEREVISHLLQP